MKNYIIPIFIPHLGCRHTCIFCNQKSITGVTKRIVGDDVKSIIENRLPHIMNRQNRLVEVAFYGGSFTGLPISVQRELLMPIQDALNSGFIDAIRLSTRPDYITRDIIELLRELGVSTVELGVQSMDEKVLALAQRGHSAQDVVRAITIIREGGLNVGAQLMVGLPGQTVASIIDTVGQIVSLKPDFARIYPTLVIQNTVLADEYVKGIYRPISLVEAIRQAAFMKSSFTSNGIPVIRTGLQATEELSDDNIVLAGPYHPAFGEMVDSYLYLHVMRKLLKLGDINIKIAKVVFHHNSHETSKIRGNTNSNLKSLCHDYPDFMFSFIGDHDIPGEIVLEYGDILIKDGIKSIYANELVKEGIGNGHEE